ncbi:unnamed protein product [Parnassius apollo]|uniref:(apollo) hypothetical protein n=1 Tax=Parnassius apollo TaxID=110799 RepID=A0A8S3XSV6_PARAO|nr:unnamed protein product [Parnassius apollo]
MDTENIILTGDFNARSLWWGSRAEDERGLLLSEMIAELDMNVLNQGSDSTFYQYRGGKLHSSIVDVTCCTSAILHKMERWRVDPDFVTLSDHRAIQFQMIINIDKQNVVLRNSTRLFNTAKANWSLFRNDLKERLEKENVTEDKIKTIQTPEELDDIVDTYVKQQNLDGNRSVTRQNKDNIKKSLDEINRSSQQLFDQVKTILRHSISSAENKTVSIIRNTIKEELSKFTQKPQQHFTQPLQHPLRQIPATKSPQSYANAVKSITHSKRPIPTTKPAIIVSAKQPVSSPQETVSAWRKSIHFKHYTFSPAEVKQVSNNKLRVEFDTQEQRDKIIEAINCPESLVNADIAKKLKPMLILKGIHIDTPVTELKDIIINQNPTIKNLVKTPDDISYRFMRNNKNKKLYNTVFMVTPQIWRTAVELQKLNIDHQRVHVEDHPAYLQCYKCLLFGHTKKHCPEDKLHCSHCSSSGHSYKDCPDKKEVSKIDCYNCIAHNKKYNLNLNTKHSATSLRCPRIQKQIESCKNRTDYGC